MNTRKACIHALRTTTIQLRKALVLFLIFSAFSAFANVQFIDISIGSEHCAGTNNGYIIAFADCSSCANGNADLEYSLNGGTYQSDNTFSALAGGTYTISVRDQNNTGCAASETVTVRTDHDTCYNPATKRQDLVLLALSVDGGANDISGDYAIVGASQDQNDMGIQTGIAFIYKKETDGSWCQLKKIFATDGEVDDLFGLSVAIHENYAVVGTPFKRHNGTDTLGAAYIFHKDAGGIDNWGQVRKIEAAGITNNLDVFGLRVAISGNYVVIGAAGQDRDENDGAFLENAGATYVFHKDEGGIDNWGQVQKLVDNDRESNEVFGAYVSISGDWIAVSTQEFASGPLENMGTVDFFKLNTSNNTWEYKQKVFPSNPNKGALFGRRIDISGDQIIIGTPWKFLTDTVGAAYIYRLDNANDMWNQEAELSLSNPFRHDNFGYSVGIQGDYAIVGTPGEDEDDSSNTQISSGGAAYLYKRAAGGNWNQVRQILLDTRDVSTNYGENVHISGKTLMISSSKSDLTFMQLDTVEIKDINTSFTCGAGLGSITVTAEGSNNLEYSIDGSNFQSSNIFTAVPEGTYTVQVRDADEITCTATKIIGLIGIEAALDYAHESCAGVENGHLNIIANCKICPNGSEDLEYSIDGSSFQDQSTFTGLTGGTYTVYVRDKNMTNCDFSQTITIQSSAVCNDCDANISIAQQKLVALHRSEIGSFGSSLAISGKYAIVGTPGDRLDVNGNNPFSNAGAAYIFERNSISNTWAFFQKITATDRFNQSFGKQVAMSGKYIAVGTDSDDVYIFEYIYGQWRPVKAFEYILDPSISGTLGQSIAMTEDYLVVGSPSELGNGAMPLNGAGTAYIFKRNSSNEWVFLKKIYASTQAAGAKFGISVDISADQIIVGAEIETAPSYMGVGAAYIFKKDEGGSDNWGEHKKIVTPEGTANGSFGARVGISEESAVVSDLFINNGMETAIYIYKKDEGGVNNWGNVQKITRSNSTNNTDNFGSALDIEGNTIIVGARFHDVDEDGTNQLYEPGAAYIFEEANNGTWVENKKIVHYDRQASDRFGSAVAISEQYVIAGAPQEKEDINGNNTLYAAGSAYVMSNCFLEFMETGIADITTSCDQGITVTINAKGAAEIEYALDNGAFQASNIFTNVSIGEHAIRIRNANDPACIAACTLEVANMSVLDMSVLDETCSNAKDGEISVLASCPTCENGLDDLEYSVDGTNFQASNILGGLAAGTYTVTIRHRIHTTCTATSQAVVIQGGTVACNQCGSPDANNKIVASNRSLDQNFGRSVATSVHYTIVGASDGVGGAAYIYRHNTDGTMTEVQRIESSDVGANDSFGVEVDIQGDYAIVGAYNEDENEDGNTTLAEAGAAYIFKRNSSGTWVQIKKLVASDREPNDEFGISVSIDGDYAVVGARAEDDDYSNINFMGAAYVFKRNQGGTDNWGEVKKIVASDRNNGSYFGQSVSVSGETIAVGAWAVNTDASGGNTLATAGAAYIFQRDQGGANNWGEVKKITNSDRAAGDNFGVGIAISANDLVVGAIGQSTDASGANNINAAGAAYIFQRNQGGANNWGEVKKIVASDRAAVDLLGEEIDISGDYVVLGAKDENDDSSGFANTGATYVFRRDAGGANNWGETEKLLASIRKAEDEFGSGVGIWGTRIVVGAQKEDEDSDDMNTLSQAGAIYIFDSCPIEISDVIVTNETCASINDGTITITAAGLTNMEYSIDGTNFQTTAAFTGLADGTYLVRVRDADNPSCVKVCESTVIAGPACGVSLAPKIFLQGPFNGTNMQANLQIPLHEPYSSMGYTFVGGGSEMTNNTVLAVTGSSAIVDWVVVELRDSTTPSTVVESRAALLRSDGMVVDVDGTSPVHFTASTGINYHVAIRHRNHLGVMTSNPIGL